MQVKIVERPFKSSQLTWLFSLINNFHLIIFIDYKGTGAEGFPCQFSKWDTNKDGKVDKAEFEAMLKDKENEVTLEKLFMLIDSNGKRKHRRWFLLCI